jgi:FSR family fosmidomycin resistance protein-like MFS transporter
MLHPSGPQAQSSGRRSRGDGTFYLIEFFDEFVFGLLIVALPLIRDDLHLDYVQIGLLLGLPMVASVLAEPIVLLLGDTRLRPVLILAGGVGLAANFTLLAAADAFPLVLAALVLAYPSSGAFVSLSQAELIGRHPGRETQVMARWTAAGTIGSLLGPATLAGALLLSGSWRGALAACAAGAALLTLAAARTSLRVRGSGRPEIGEIAGGVAANVRALVRQGRLWRWLILLPLADLLLDVFFGYLALYFTDVVGVPVEIAALGTTLWLAAFLVGQLLLPRVLDRIEASRLLRLSATAMVLVFPLWLLAPVPAGWRIATVAGLGLLAAPWYPLLKGEAYAAAPGRPATVGALESVVSGLGGVLAAAVGAAAAHYGLTAAMLLLTLGPLSLFLLTPGPPSSDS